jgi:hypothetical protein
LSQFFFVPVRVPVLYLAVPVPALFRSEKNIKVNVDVVADDHLHTEHQAQLEMGEKLYHCHLCNNTDGFDEFYFLEKHLRSVEINLTGSGPGERQGRGPDPLVMNADSKHCLAAVK